jgi:tetratricopeptide (TPR) repeat protein
LRPPDELWPKAKAAATNAHAHDSSLSEAHSTLGLVRSFYEWNWKAAGQEFKKAIELEKNNPNALSRYAIYLSRVGRHDEAIEHMEQARAMDPLSLNINNAVAVLYYMARRYGDAIERCETNLELSSTYYRTYWNLGRSRLAKAEFGPAVEALERARELSREKPPEDQAPNQPNDLSLENPFMMAVLADGYARAGRTGEAHRVMDQLKAIGREKYVSPAAWAAVYLGLGDHDRAFEWLAKAVEERSSLLVWLKVDPAFDPIRGDRRFQKLLAAVGLN